MYMTVIQLKAWRTSLRKNIVNIINIGLDNNMKSKLQVLIKSHMSKLLMKIDEENNSVMDKSLHS
jgi:hypothetical protein